MLSIIVAVSDNNVIGKDGTLPWQLPADLAHFKRTTIGHAIIMGRKNYEDIGRPLPGRQNIIITRNPSYTAEGCEVAHSLEEALKLAGDDDAPFIIGGSQIYAEALPMVSRIYLTRVHATIDGDTFFNELIEADWRELSREDHKADERNEYDYSFIKLERG